MRVTKDAYIICIGCEEETVVRIVLGSKDAQGWQQKYEAALAVADWISLLPKAPYKNVLPFVRTDIPEGADYVFYIRTMGVLGHPTLPDGDVESSFYLGWRKGDVQQVMEISPYGTVRMYEGKEDIPHGSNR